MLASVEKKQFVIQFTASFPAAIVAKHFPSIYPDMFTKGSPVSPGSAAFMALQKKEIVRKGGKYGNCTTEWPQGLHLNRAAIAKARDIFSVAKGKEIGV